MPTQEAAEVTLTLTLTQILPLRRYCDVIGVCVRARALTHTHTRAHTLTHTHRLKLHFMGLCPSPLSCMAVVGRTTPKCERVWGCYEVACIQARLRFLVILAGDYDGLPANMRRST